MGTVNAGWAPSWLRTACALARMSSYAPDRGSPAKTPRNPFSGQSELPSPSKREASGHRAGEQRAELRAASRRQGPAENPPREAARAGRAVGYSPRGPRAPRAGPSRRRLGCRTAVRDPGERGCGRAGPTPRLAYESAAGRAPRGGNYGKAAGEGRGPRTFAISRLAAHSWHSWDPQEFSSFGSPGGRADGTLQRCGTPGLGGRAGTGGKGSGRGLGRKSGNRKRRAGHPGGSSGPRRLATRAGAERSEAGGIPRGHLLSRPGGTPPGLPGRDSLGTDKRSRQTSDCVGFRAIKFEF